MDDIEIMDDIEKYMRLLLGRTAPAKEQAAPEPVYAQPTNDLMQRINPIYTRQQPNNSLAPMDMYRNYKQFGVMPAETNSFVPYSAPAPGPTTAPTSSVSTAGIGQTSSTSGGGGGK